MKKIFRAFYFTVPFYLSVIGIIVGFVLGFFFPLLYIISQYVLAFFAGLVIIDSIILFRVKSGVFARRDTMDKLSNGDDNPIQVHIENFYPFSIRTKIIDELPFQFQLRNSYFNTSLNVSEKKIIQYHVRPVKRGEYSFGAVNVFVKSPIGLTARRYKFSQDIMVPVYPSFIQMRKYELLAISNRLTETGIKRVRRIGQNREFELIKEYVSGD